MDEKSPALDRIADAIEAIAISQVRQAEAMEQLSAATAATAPAPNLTKSLGSYINFDWSSIGAKVIKSDADGAIAVVHNGKIYTRRNPVNKFDLAIWYSRCIGKEDNENLYERLVTFKVPKIEAEPLNQKTRDRLSAYQQRSA